MKLSTMLLPTGEFILVASEIDGTQDQVDAEAWEQFRGKVGAVAAIVTTDEVQIEDALVQKPARRADETVEVEFAETDLQPYLTTLADMVSELSLQGNIEENLHRLGFTTAGLRIGNTHSVGVTEVNGFLEPEKHPKAEPETYELGPDDLVVGTGGPVDGTWPVRPEDAGSEVNWVDTRPKFEVGTRVEITGPSFYVHDVGEMVGKQGVVVRGYATESELQGCVYVQIPRPGEFWPLHWYYDPSNLKVVE